RVSFTFAAGSRGRWECPRFHCSSRHTCCTRDTSGPRASSMQRVRDLTETPWTVGQLTHAERLPASTFATPRQQSQSIDRYHRAIDSPPHFWCDVYVFNVSHPIE